MGRKLLLSWLKLIKLERIFKQEQIVGDKVHYEKETA